MALSKILFLAGVPFGNKVVQKYPIPEWILGDKAYFAIFLKRYFDCEGCVNIKKPEIKISVNKEISLTEDGLSFMNQIKQGLLVNFGITSTRPFLLSERFERKYGTAIQIRLKVIGKENLRRFSSQIGFDSREKRKKLAMAIE